MDTREQKAAEILKAYMSQKHENLSPEEFTNLYLEVEERIVKAVTAYQKEHSTGETKFPEVRSY